MAPRGKKAGGGKKANGYKMPPPIPLGEVIHDTIGKRKWRIGPSIGIGGFGEIYVACDDNEPKKGQSYPFVIKIEPYENGPLFVEKHFYVRNANKDDIENFKKSKKLSSLGMPAFYGSGSHEFRGEKLRYLVLEKYGTDIWKKFLEAGKVFPTPTVFQLGLQMLDVIEYIHSRGYVHADLKGSNILLGIKKGTENQTYLLDFGLAQKAGDKEFKPDPNRAHNGTIEYTSRDAHRGAPTLRGDLEILGYNLLQWLVGTLPWEHVLTNPTKVQEMKEELFKDVKAISKKYPGVPDALIKFFEYVKTLKPMDRPDYAKCCQFFETYLKSVGKTRSSKLEFTATKLQKDKSAAGNDGDAPKPKRGRKPKAKIVESDNAESDNDEQNNVAPKMKKTTKAKVKRAPRDEESDSDDLPLKQNSQASTGKRIKKPTVITIASDSDDDASDAADAASKPKQRKPRTKRISDSENEPDVLVKKRVARKRKSLTPSVVHKVKKAHITPKHTPPAKQNHVNMSTQTSEPRQTRHTPKQIAIVTPNKSSQLSNSVVSNSLNSSGDIFDDSFEIKKLKPKKKLLSEEEIVETRVVKKKVTTVKKGSSWKDSPAVLNGRSPPK